MSDKMNTLKIITTINASILLHRQLIIQIRKPKNSFCQVHLFLKAIYTAFNVLVKKLKYTFLKDIIIFLLFNTSQIVHLKCNKLSESWISTVIDLADLFIASN